MKKRFTISNIFLVKLLIISIFTFAGLEGIAQQAKTYDEAIIMADKKMEEAKFLDAKAYYQIAQKFKPSDEYAKQQINKIVQQLSNNADIEDQYLEIVLEADKLFNNKELDKAKEVYNRALELIPDDDYAKEQISIINKAFADETEKLESFNNSIEEGIKLKAEHKYEEAISSFKKAKKIMPDNAKTTDLIAATRTEKEEYESKYSVFQEEVEMANRYLSIKNYIEAVSHLEKALSLLPEEWAVEKEIEKYKPLAEKQQLYTEAVAEADELYVKRNYSAAKQAYKKASELWDENAYSSDMINKIDEQLAEQMANLDENYKKSVAKADSLFEVKEFNDALNEYNFALNLKKDETYPKKKIKEINEIFAIERKKTEKQYQAIIASADSLFALQKFENSKIKYTLALEQRPDDDYPKQQIKEIEKQQTLLAEQIKIKSKYDTLIAEADNLVNSKDFKNAIAKYREAMIVLPDQTYPQKRIEEVEDAIANAARQKEIDSLYNIKIAMADRLFAENNLNDARTAYLASAEINPLEKYPAEKIEEIDKLLKEKALQKEIDEKYQTLISKSDSSLKLNDFDNSIVFLEQALKLKEADVFATNQIEKVKTQKAEYEAAITLQKKYDDLITSADQQFADEKYIDARTSYNEAILLKSDEKYPVDRLAEIKVILDKKAEEINKKYALTITKADNLFNNSNFGDALVQYKIASSLKPDELYPKDRIAETNSRIEEKLKLVRNEYNLAIAEADKLYAAKIYDKAITAYQKADAIFPDENYPEEMIAKITNLIETNAIVDVIKEKTQLKSGTTTKFEFEPVRINVRKSNYILVKAKNISGNSFKIIFGYGSKTGKNGGFVVTVPQGEESNDYIIRVGNQYKWFADDNNWISVYPENGDIEISLVRISKAE